MSLSSSVKERARLFDGAKANGPSADANEPVKYQSLRSPLKEKQHLRHSITQTAKHESRGDGSTARGGLTNRRDELKAFANLAPSSLGGTSKQQAARPKSRNEGAYTSPLRGSPLRSNRPTGPSTPQYHQQRSEVTSPMNQNGTSRKNLTVQIRAPPKNDQHSNKFKGSGSKSPSAVSRYLAGQERRSSTPEMPARSANQVRTFRPNMPVNDNEPPPPSYNTLRSKYARVQSPSPREQERTNRDSRPPNASQPKSSGFGSELISAAKVLARAPNLPPSNATETNRKTLYTNNPGIPNGSWPIDIRQKLDAASIIMEEERVSLSSSSSSSTRSSLTNDQLATIAYSAYDLSSKGSSTQQTSNTAAAVKQRLTYRQIDGLNTSGSQDSGNRPRVYKQFPPPPKETNATTPLGPNYPPMIHESSSANTETPLPSYDAHPFQDILGSFDSYRRGLEHDESENHGVRGTATMTSSYDRSVNEPIHEHPEDHSSSVDEETTSTLQYQFEDNPVGSEDYSISFQPQMDGSVKGETNELENEICGTEARTKISESGDELEATVAQNTTTTTPIENLHDSPGRGPEKNQHVDSPRAFATSPRSDFETNERIRSPAQTSVDTPSEDDQEVDNGRQHATDEATNDNQERTREPTLGINEPIRGVSGAVDSDLTEDVHHIKPMDNPDLEHPGTTNEFTQARLETVNEVLSFSGTSKDEADNEVVQESPLTNVHPKEMDNGKMEPVNLNGINSQLSGGSESHRQCDYISSSSLSEEMSVPSPDCQDVNSRDPLDDKGVVDSEQPGGNDDWTESDRGDRGKPATDIMDDLATSDCNNVKETSHEKPAVNPIEKEDLTKVVEEPSKDHTTEANGEDEIASVGTKSATNLVSPSRLAGTAEEYNSSAETDALRVVDLPNEIAASPSPTRDDEKPTISKSTDCSADNGASTNSKHDSTSLVQSDAAIDQDSQKYDIAPSATPKVLPGPDLPLSDYALPQQGDGGGSSPIGYTDLREKARSPNASQKLLRKVLDETDLIPMSPNSPRQSPEGKKSNPQQDLDGNENGSRSSSALRRWEERYNVYNETENVEGARGRSPSQRERLDTREDEDIFDGLEEVSPRDAMPGPSPNNEIVVESIQRELRDTERASSPQRYRSISTGYLQHGLGSPVVDKQGKMSQTKRVSSPQRYLSISTGYPESGPGSPMSDKQDERPRKSNASSIPTELMKNTRKTAPTPLDVRMDEHLEDSVGSGSRQESRSGFPSALSSNRDVGENRGSGESLSDIAQQKRDKTYSVSAKDRRSKKNRFPSSAPGQSGSSDDQTNRSGYILNPMREPDDVAPSVSDSVDYDGYESVHTNTHSGIGLEEEDSPKGVFAFLGYAILDSFNEVCRPARGGRNNQFNPSSAKIPPPALAAKLKCWGEDRDDESFAQTLVEESTFLESELSEEPKAKQPSKAEQQPPLVDLLPSPKQTSKVNSEETRTPKMDLQAEKTKQKSDGLARNRSETNVTMGDLSQAEKQKLQEWNQQHLKDVIVEDPPEQPDPRPSDESKGDSAEPHATSEGHQKRVEDDGANAVGDHDLMELLSKPRDPIPTGRESPTKTREALPSPTKELPSPTEALPSPRAAHTTAAEEFPTVREPLTKARGPLVKMEDHSEVRVSSFEEEEDESDEEHDDVQTRRLEAQRRLLDHAKQAVEWESSSQAFLSVHSESARSGLDSLSYKVSVSPKSVNSNKTLTTSDTQVSAHQKKALERFSLLLNNERLEVLKLNRHSKWQVRYLTLSKEYESDHEYGRCPKALLWLKTASGKNTGLAGIGDEGKGGFIFSQLRQIERDTIKYPPAEIPKKLKSKFPNYVGVRITYQADDGHNRLLVFCFKTKGDAKAFCAYVDAIRSAVQRE